MNGVWDYLLPICERHSDYSYSKSPNFTVIDELKQCGLKPELAYIWGVALERVRIPLDNVYICEFCHKETNYRHYIRNGEGKRKAVCRACKVEAKS